MRELVLVAGIDDRGEAAGDLLEIVLGNLAGGNIVKSQGAGSAAGRLIACCGVLRLKGLQIAPVGLGVRIQATDHFPSADGAGIVGDSDFCRKLDDTAAIEVGELDGDATDVAPDAVSAAEEITHDGSQRWTELGCKKRFHVKIRQIINWFQSVNRGVYGGGGGIRTHETVARLPVFKTGAFNRSATPPDDAC